MPYPDRNLMTLYVEAGTEALPHRGHRLAAIPLSGIFGYETCVDNFEEDWNGIAAAAD
jgi:hypothetical protein